MSDISYSFSLPQHTQESSGDALTWSFNGTRNFPGPAGTSILYRALTDKRLIAQPELLHAMRHCNHFRTLESHAANILESLPELREAPEDVVNTLIGVRDAGLLESSKQAWDRLSTTAVPPLDIGCRVFILTCDRPAALSRLLNALSKKPLPRPIEGICVIDDSRNASHIEENHAIVSDAQSAFSVPLSHFDIAARNELIKALEERLPEHCADISFLLDRHYWGGSPTYGLARNLALLLSVGKNALVLDDDVIPEAIAPPLAAHRLSIGTANQRQAVFHGDSKALNQHMMALSESPLTLMLEHLGQPIGHVLTSSLPGHGALAGWDGELTTLINSHSRLLLSQCGSWGDPGTAGNSWPFFLEEPTIKRLLNAGANTEALLSARASWFGYRGPVISQFGTMSQLTGISNNVLLPPYLPAGRGEDILFGILVLRMHPDSAVFNEGWAIRHEPLEDRKQRGGIKPLSANADMSLLADWLGRAPADQWGLSAKQRLIVVAEEINRLSMMEDDAIADIIAAELVSKAGSLLSGCFSQIDIAERLVSSPGYDQWIQFLHATRDSLVTRIQHPDATPLEHVSKHVGDLTVLRTRGRHFASALRAWPSLIAAMGEIEI